MNVKSFIDSIFKKKTKWYVKNMSQQSNASCDMLFGIILIGLPFFALLFGSDEPAMQTDNAALVMTGMIFFGIIMLASASSKRKKKSATTYTQPTYTHQSTPVIATTVNGYCQYCGTSHTEPDARFCSRCGKSLSSTSSGRTDGSF